MAASWSARQTRAAAKHHVLGGVRRAGKPGGAFIGADAIIDHGGDHRRERVADNDDLQAVGQRGAQDAGADPCIIGRRVCGCEAQEKRGHHELGKIR